MFKRRRVQEHQQSYFDFLLGHDVAKIVQSYCFQACVLGFVDGFFEFDDIYDLDISNAKPYVPFTLTNQGQIMLKTYNGSFIVRKDPNLFFVCHSDYGFMYEGFVNNEEIPSLESQIEGTQMVHIGFSNQTLLATLYSSSDSSLAVWEFDTFIHKWNVVTTILKMRYPLSEKTNLICGNNEWISFCNSGIVYFYNRTSCKWDTLDLNVPLCETHRQCHEYFINLIVVNDDLFLFQRVIQTHLIVPVIFNMQSRQFKTGKHMQINTCKTKGTRLWENCIWF